MKKKKKFIWPVRENEVKVTLSCLTLCDPMDYSQGNSLGQNTGVDSLSLLQEIISTQVSHISGRFFTS